MVGEGNVSRFALSTVDRSLRCAKATMNARVRCDWNGCTFEACTLMESTDVGCGQSGPGVVGW